MDAMSMMGDVHLPGSGWCRYQADLWDRGGMQGSQRLRLPV
jgi:hypothetical protein